jgi:hypothetical protein
MKTYWRVSQNLGQLSHESTHNHASAIDFDIPIDLSAMCGVLCPSWSLGHGRFSLES